MTPRPREQPGAGPSRRRLTRVEIERAALAIVDGEGLEALTMRRLGAELGVEGMAIYHHVPSKAALLDRVVTRVVDEVRFEPRPGDAWRSVLAGFGRAYRSALLAHPRAMPIIATRPVATAPRKRAPAVVLPQRGAGSGPGLRGRARGYSRMTRRSTVTPPTTSAGTSLDWRRL